MVFMAPDSTKPVRVPASDVPKVWDRVRELFAAVSRKNPAASPPDAVLERLLRREWQLWVLGDPIVAVTATGLVPRCDGTKALHLEQVAGNADWTRHIATLEAWGREEGCTRVVMPRARRGWARKFPDFRDAAVMLEREI